MTSLFILKGVSPAYNTVLATLTGTVHSSQSLLF